MGAVCATPPHLEGAPLFQIPLASLNCDGNVNKYDNADVLHQLEALSSESNLTFAREFSDAVRLLIRSLRYCLYFISAANSIADHIEKYPFVS